MRLFARLGGVPATMTISSAGRLHDPTKGQQWSLDLLPRDYDARAKVRACGRHDRGKLRVSVGVPSESDTRLAVRAGMPAFLEVARGLYLRFAYHLNLK